MNIKFLESRIEELAEAVHNAWCEKKRKQGFHDGPSDCPYPYKSTFAAPPCNCDLCHADMIPYRDLEKDIKEYDRATVRAVLNVIQRLSILESDIKIIGKPKSENIIDKQTIKID